MNSLFQLLGSGIGVAIVSGVFMLIQSQMQRKSEEKAACKKLTESKIDELIASVDTMKDTNLVVLHDRIKYLARKHIENGFVPYDARQDVLAMYQIYHERLGGNGNVADLVQRFRDVAVK